MNAARWLAVVFGAIAAVGWSLLAYRAAIWDWHRLRVAEAFGVADVPPVAVPWVDLFGAVLAGTLAAWGVALAWIAAVPLARGERWAAYAIATSLLAWFPVDTWVSWALGAHVNVAFNVAALAAIVPLLAAAWRRTR